MFELLNPASTFIISVLMVVAGMALCWLVGAPLIILFKGNKAVTDFICNAALSMTVVLVLIMIFCTFRWVLAWF